MFKASFLLLIDPASKATCSLALSSVALAGIWLNKQNSCFCFAQPTHNSSLYFCKHSTCLSVKREHLAPGVRCTVIKHNSPLDSITQFAFVILSLTNTVPVQCHKRKDVRSKCCHRSHSKSWMIASNLGGRNLTAASPPHTLREGAIWLVLNTHLTEKSAEIPFLNIQSCIYYYRKPVVLSYANLPSSEVISWPAEWVLCNHKPV